MGLKTTRISTQSPLPISELSGHLRGSEQPADVLNALALAAVDYVEGYTHRTLLTAELVLTLNRFPETIRLPGSPVDTDSIVIEYVATDGDTETLSESLYRVTSASEPVCITRAYGASWPTPRAVTEAVTVTYTAGYGDTLETAPESIKHAIKMLVAHWHENAEAVITGTISAPTPMAVDALLNPHRLGAQVAFAGLDNACGLAS